MLVYKDERTQEISFPLGGIGSGCIGLAGNGRLVDWEIFNRPNKGSTNGLTHFAVKVEDEDQVLDARILNGDLPPPYSGHERSFGHGPAKATMAGAPHFKDAIFKGAYPFAYIHFVDDTFPGQITMMAFNPLIPLNDQDSSIPGAFFEFDAVNTTKQILTYTFALSMCNPIQSNASVNSYLKRDDIHMLHFRSDEYSSDHIKYGDACIATDAEEACCQEYWYRGAWLDNLNVYWKEFTQPGMLLPRTYQADDPGRQQDTGILAARITLNPGESKKVRFIISWNFPNCNNYWNPETCSCQTCEGNSQKTWKNYYTKLFADSRESAVYGLVNWKYLYGQTKVFNDALFSSTLPDEALDAISSNLSTLKSPTCLRLTDGSFYGFEGCNCDTGCCEGSCTHVWNYVYTLPFLFPKLDRSMLDLDYAYNQRDDGGMAFRLQLPLGRKRSNFRPCADGQFGGVIKAYRYWKISGDADWLFRNWKSIQKSIDFAWAPTNEDKWDADKDGVLEGRQHHTLDMELFGPSSWLTGFYLAALKAGTEMAEFLGYHDKVEEYRNLFATGKKWVDQNLFNGQYYYHKIDLSDRSILERYNSSESVIGGDAIHDYWNQEIGEIKYQIGEGSSIDQVLAQWHANLCGLGEIFDNEQVRKALASIYRFNFKKSMRSMFNPYRYFSLNDESGAIICEWPENVKKPTIPILDAQETMCGFEYQVAIHMIQEGMIDEGMDIVSAIRARFDGQKRNPWNEFECGSNYARSMASYALLNAFSGFAFDMNRGMIGFYPVNWFGDDFRVFWSLDPAWGVFHIDHSRVELRVLYGSLRLLRLGLPSTVCMKIRSVKIGNESINYTLSESEQYILFDREAIIHADESIQMTWVQ